MASSRMRIHCSSRWPIVGPFVYHPTPLHRRQRGPEVLVLHSVNIPNGRRYTYGGGGGVGLQFTPRATWLWQPIFDVDGGFLAFPHGVPTPNTRRVNMTRLRPRYSYPVKGNHAMRTGVWLFHFSDGNCVLQSCVRQLHGLLVLYLPQFGAPPSPPSVIPSKFTWPLWTLPG